MWPLKLQSLLQHSKENEHEAPADRHVLPEEPDDEPEEPEEPDNDSEDPDEELPQGLACGRTP